MEKEDNQYQDFVGQSGWVFADLLLALSVIFLATISFVPNSQGTKGVVNSNVPELTSASQSVGSRFSGSFSKVYELESLDSAQRDILRYVEEQGFSEKVSILNLRIVGGDNLDEEKSGVISALKASLDIRNSLPELTRFAKVELSTSPSVKQSQVLIVLLFGVLQQNASP